MFVCFFFFNDTATTEIYTLSLHDALPISGRETVLRVARRAAAPLAKLLQVLERQVVSGEVEHRVQQHAGVAGREHEAVAPEPVGRSEEHTSELQSLAYLVCRLLLEKKKKKAKERYM